MKSAVVIGVGAECGLGGALSRRFSAENFHVYVAGRTLSKIESVVQTINKAGGSAEACETDVSKESDIIKLFQYVYRENPRFQAPDLIVFNAGNNKMINFLDLKPEEVEAFWRVGTLGGFIVSQEAIRHLLPLKKGTIIFTGASASVRGKPGYAHFSAAKAGLRMLSQSLAREFGPQGIHVAHVIVDGGIDGDLMRRTSPLRYKNNGESSLLIPEDIAEVFWYLHTQPSSAWTQEIDLRPSQESF